MKTVFAIITLFLVVTPGHGQTLNDLLLRAGSRTERFIDEFSLVRCTEQMVQSKLDSKGKVAQREASEFDYVGIVHVSNGIAKVEESRVSKKTNTPSAGASQFVTSGFATLILIFHPQFRDSFSFADLITEPHAGSRTIRFEFKSGARSITVFRFRDRNYPVEWKGTAWIDPVNGTVQRIHAEMMNPIADLGLQSLEADVEYAPVKFTEAPEPLWLPKTATVDLETHQQHWKNSHVFRDYSMFTVNTSTSVGH